MSKPVIERVLERVLFASRWLLAPFYLGLVLALGGLLVVFGHELLNELTGLARMTAHGAVLMALNLIDLSLVANLVVIVMFSGYENFVSRMETADAADRPGWMGTVDFSGLKMKVIASIVAISAIALLRAFIDLLEPGAAPDAGKLQWLIAIQFTFVLSGVLLAIMDWVSGLSGKHD
jgi:uncharacterized protein (TIGR00645 family)